MAVLFNLAHLTNQSRVDTYKPVVGHIQTTSKLEAIKIAQ